ncbi:MAG: SRPBCC domain-containing protein, partial [Burkholderiales bacterium]
SRMIAQSVVLPAPPARLYRMYLDQKQHAAIIDASARITPRAGGRFSVWGGDIHGVILQLVPRRLIVQTWRAKEWKKTDVDSTLVLSFHPDRKGGRIELVHVNVPKKHLAGVRQGWRDYYWTPWRALVSKR